MLVTERNTIFMIHPELHPTNEAAHLIAWSAMETADWIFPTPDASVNRHVLVKVSGPLSGLDPTLSHILPDPKARTVSVVLARGTDLRTPDSLGAICCMVARANILLQAGRYYPEMAVPPLSAALAQTATGVCQALLELNGLVNNPGGVAIEQPRYRPVQQ